MNNWHKLTIVIPGICAGFLLFLLLALPVHAEQPCLRGGDGTCVELLKEKPASSGAFVPPSSLTGPSNATNFFTLQDGSMVAMLAKAKTSFGNNGVTNMNRYEIGLFYTNDGGVTWTQPPVTNKGQWYVDELRDGAVASGTSMRYTMDPGVGFLGFDVSTVYDAAAKKTYIVLAHTIACPKSNTNGYPDGNGFVPSITTFDEYIAGSGSWNCDNPGVYVSGSVYVDTIVYDHADHSFDEFGKTRSFTHSDGIINGGWTCEIGICYGAAWGADHPSISATLVDSQLHIWTSYSAFRGGNCYYDSYYWNQCADQNMRDWNNPSDGYNYDPPIPGDESQGNIFVKKLWVRHLKIDKTTGALSAVNVADPRADNYDMGERIPASGSGTRNNADYFVSKIVIMRGQYPLLLYSYSSPTSAKNPLQWRYWNGSSWTAAQSVEGADPSVIIKNNYTGIQHIVGSVLLSNAWEKIPTLAAVAAPRYSSQLPYNYTSNNSSNQMAVVAAYGKTTNSKYVPIFLRFFMNDVGLISNNPEALVLADDTNPNPDSLGIDATTNLPMYVNPDLGGPSIGWGRSYSYIAVPESVNNDKNTSSAVYARIKASTTSNWADPLSSSWFVDRDSTANPDTPIYFQVTNPSPGVAEGFSQPKVTNYPSQYIPLGGTARLEALSNIFSVQMIFSRAQDNSVSCSSGNWCAVGYSGNYNTNAIRGWAWAESVGWVSLSCANLNTCFSKNYNSSGTAWSTKEGGLYYGVRAVTNVTFPSRTLIGKAWSERVGYLSFDRETGMYKGNPCGNPPVATTSPYYITNNPTARECARLRYNVTDSTLTVIALVDENNTPVTTADFKSAGSLRIDSEVINYNGIDSNGVLQNVRRENTSPALANKTYISKARSHAAGTPVFWINGNDVTTDANGAYDIIRGINSFDPSSYQLDGYARAESWATYQRDYCKNPVSGEIEIGSSYPAPCDKEWGWVKMSGEWSTVHWGTAQTSFTQSCNSSTLYSTSVDGYPDPALTGENEKLYVSGPNTYLWEYSGINDTSRSFALTSTLPSIPNCPANGTPVVWTATFAHSVLADSTSIQLSSVAGLLSSGKLIIHQDTNSNSRIDAADLSEVIEYSSVNTSTKTIDFVTRGADGTTAQNWGTSAFVEQVNETGNYNTFVIPVGYMQPEQTVGGFGWSAPNTETLSPDPNVSRYKDNLAGFGWINFQPNKLEQIYPYLRTLFGNLYVGGDIDIVGPEYNSITPKQYSSTYQIETDGSITPYIGERQGASSGQLQQCLAACSDQTCMDECNNAYGPSDAPNFDFTQGSASVLGKVPDLEAMSTLVSQCQGWDPDTSSYIDLPCGNANGQQARELDTEAEFDGLATTGLNKYGQQVILCRARPSVPEPRSDAVFFGGGYTKNPPECKWSASQGFTATVAEAYPAGQNFVCVQNISGLITSDTGKMTFGNDAASMNTVSYAKTTDNTGCAVSTKLNITFTSTVDASVGATVSETNFPSYRKVKISHTGRPTVYILPDSYSFFAFQRTPMQFNNAPEGSSGAITFVFPGSIFFLDSSMRYCPQGLNLLPCKASDDIQYDPITNNNPNTKVTDTSQIASVAWLVNGSITHLDGYGDMSFYPEAKMYRVGAFVAMGKTNETWWMTKPGTFWSIYMLNTGFQFNLYGLVMARNYLLTSHYYKQDENEFVIEPAENFIYDGRVVVNPPPGLEDLASGLPTIRQAIP